MSILLLLVPLALMLLILAIAAFAWAVRGGQFEDLETPALSILADDEEPVGHSREGGDPAKQAPDQ
jgi:cbb3-type cytochrome oxidase maturation protein